MCGYEERKLVCAGAIGLFGGRASWTFLYRVYICGPLFVTYLAPFVVIGTRYLVTGV